MYRLRPGWAVMRESDERLLFFDEVRAFVVRARHAWLDELESCLSGEHPTAAPAIGALFDRLMAQGAIVMAGNEDSHGQFSRQIEYFWALTDEPHAVQRRLETSTVLVLGLGGTGGEFLRLMVAAGIGNYALVDKDVVELSNLNRQTLYSRADVGQAKVNVCRRFIAERLSGHRCMTFRKAVTTQEDVVDLVKVATPDLALIAIDEPAGSIVRTAATALDRVGCPFLVAGVGLRHGRSYPVSTSLAPDATVIGTTASICTTNTISAAYAAHSALEYLSRTPMPFYMHHAP